MQERGSRIHEEDVSATSPACQEKTRIPRSYEDQRRAGSPPPKTEKGPEAPHCMMETLTRKKDFARIFEEGKRIGSGPLRLFFYRRETGPVRVCFVGRSKKAVRRNRIRRRLREAFRVYYYPVWKDRPFDFVFVGDEGIALVEFPLLVRWMGELLGRVEQDG